MNNKEIKANLIKQLNDDAYLTSITKKSFESADRNRNGTIDIKELKACMIDIAQGLGTAIPKDEIVRDEFYKLDRDKNKTIDFVEFKAFVKANMIKIINRIPDRP